MNRVNFYVSNYSYTVENSMVELSLAYFYIRILSYIERE